MSEGYVYCIDDQYLHICAFYNRKDEGSQPQWVNILPIFSNRIIFCTVLDTLSLVICGSRGPLE
jgi:hypothetical protein